ncbi:MAG: response regulator [Armatimonadetes bacterium]|nr:response regulator [Armatimonadota bacterium]
MAKLILVVEDEHPVARLIQVNLESVGYEVRVAANGAEALAALAEQMPALVVLDVVMPRMDGFEVLRHLKSDPDTADLPVVMLTARSDEQSIFQGWAGGVHSYMTKPFHPEDLLLLVERMLSDVTYPDD